MKTVFLNSAPGLSFSNHFSPHPIVSLQKRNSTRRVTRTPLLGKKPRFHKFQQLAPVSKGVQDLLEVEQTQTEPKLSRNYQELVKEERITGKEAEKMNDEAFKKAAQKYFHQKETRHEPVNLQPPALPPPEEAPRPETATIAAVARINKEPAIKKPHQSKRTELIEALSKGRKKSGVKRKKEYLSPGLHTFKISRK